MANDCTQDAEVVSLKRYKTTMQHSAISQLESYWLGLRAGRVVPSRSDVDPRGIDRVLEYSFILERIAPGMARFRLAGMHLNDLMGMEVRGMPITSFFVPDARRRISDALEHVFEEPAIARIQLTAERGVGKPQNEASLLILPLKSDLGDISRALGCLVYEGEIGRTPRRFSVSDMTVEPLIAGIEPAPKPQSAPAPTPLITPEPMGFSEPGRTFERPAPTPREDTSRGRATHVPWLRVVSPED